MKKLLLVTFLIFLFGYPAGTLFGINNDVTSIKTICLKAAVKTKMARGKSSNSSVSNTPTLNIDAYLDGNIITIYFNGSIEGNTTITIKDIYEDIIHVENVVVNKPMEITILLDENDLDNYLLEIESSSVYIYGML